MPATSAVQASNPFIKQLASSDGRIRDRALASLRTYLHRSTPFTELDFLKLWKGLFFCMWMSDKPRNQQRLARDLAALVDVLQGEANVLGFVRAFWTTMAREWGGIESLRMDKFLYLVRCYVNKGFEHARRRHWGNEEFVDEYVKILEEVPLNPRDMKVPTGLKYHVVDILVEELDKVDTDRDAPLDRILAPMRRLAKDAVMKTMRNRAQEALADERLQDWKGARTDGDSDDDDGGVAVHSEGNLEAGGDSDGFDGFGD